MSLVIPYLSFRVQLLGVEPPIWRTFLVRTTITFDQLHSTIQAACDWEERHFYAFRETAAGPIVAGVPNYDSGRSIPDATEVTVESYFSTAGRSCIYQYDFGDNWEHEVTLLEVTGRSKLDRFIRRLTGGERAFPPEDCGGLYGYEACLAIRNGQPVDLDPWEVERKKKWLRDWQPEEFNFYVARRRFDV